MNTTVMKKTLDTLGRVIKKTPLTEKLLSRPPIQYLHDIFSEVIRTTGFLNGLYEESELNSNTVKDKHYKIAFFQKAIDVVMLVTGEPLRAKPARIVAGQEPEKTNELLQAIAKCCLNKMSSDEAVKRVLSGDKLDMKTKASNPRSRDKENRERRERHTHMVSSSRPRSSSAHPASPRVKRQESYDTTPAERLSSAKLSAQVIMDGKKLSEDEEDDKQFLVNEAAPSPSDAPEIQAEPAQELDSEEKHGGLVKKILETKTEYESLTWSQAKEQNLVSEVVQKKEQVVVTCEIEQLCSAIQMVCQSILSLGNVIDYIKEDMDAMWAELQFWQQENKNHTNALLQEQRETDQVMEPLKAELAELEQLIKDQQDKNCAKKANILMNEEKIQKMVTGINFSSRN